MSVTRGFQECVRRRATIAMLRRPGVENQEQAAEHIDSVWESCFRDTRPFDEIYR
jgi:mitochondrial inner membrane protease ATP23